MPADLLPLTTGLPSRSSGVSIPTTIAPNYVKHLDPVYFYFFIIINCFKFFVWKNTFMVLNEINKPAISGIKKK